LIGLDILFLGDPLAERGYIYQPNTIKGNKPINIGHSYSLLSILPEKEASGHAAWAVPLSGERVSLDKNGVDIASEQIQSLMCDSSLPWHEKLCVLVADTAYRHCVNFLRLWAFNSV
jgi:hypothetical protein